MFKTIKKLRNHGMFFVCCCYYCWVCFLFTTSSSNSGPQSNLWNSTFFLSLHIKLFFLEKEVNDSLLNEYSHLQLSINGYYVNGVEPFSKWSRDLWGSQILRGRGEGRYMKPNHPRYNLSFFTHFLHDCTMEFFRGDVPPDDTITLLLMKQVPVESCTLKTSHFIL